MTEAYRDGTAPVVAVDGSRLFARRPGRELFPASWLRRKAAVLHAGGDTTGTLLEFCGTGLIVATKEGKVLIAWDAIRVVELHSE
jgi:hypothetical protein